jgi:type IV secretory pathway VirB10-like protein
MKPSTMNRSISALALVPLALCASLAFGDDTMHRATPTDHQTIQQCIEKQKTKDVNMSKAEMKQFCKDELKKQKETGALPEQPPVDAAPQS